MSGFISIWLKICAGRPFFSISVRSDKADIEQSDVFGKKYQCSYGKANGNILSTIMFTFPMTSTIISSKIGYSGNMLCNNRQSANIYMSVQFTSPQLIFSNEISSDKTNTSIFCIMLKTAFTEEVDNDNFNNKIFSGKVDEFALCMMFKAAFAEDIDNDDSGNKISSNKVDKSFPHMIFTAVFAKEVDDGNTDFELIFCDCIAKASRFFTRDNQTQKSVMSRN